MLRLPGSPVTTPMKFCPDCGASVSLKVPAGDVFPRHVCEACGTIHYSNPKMVVGCIPEWESRILLCKRAIEPRRGCWTPPAGFMENGETTAEAALRETLEEASARVEIGDLYTMLSVPQVNQVHFLSRAPARPRVRAGYREPGGGPVRRSRDTVERDRVSHDLDHAPTLLRGPQAGALRLPLRRHLAPEISALLLGPRLSSQASR